MVPFFKEVTSQPNICIDCSRLMIESVKIFPQMFLKGHTYANSRGHTVSHADPREHTRTHANTRGHTGIHADTRVHIRTHTDTYGHTTTHGVTRGHRRTHTENHGHTRTHTDTLDTRGYTRTDTNTYRHTRTHPTTYAHTHTDTRGDGHARAHECAHAHAHAHACARTTCASSMRGERDLCEVHSGHDGDACTFYWWKTYVTYILDM